MVKFDLVVAELKEKRKLALQWEYKNKFKEDVNELKDYHIKKQPPRRGVVRSCFMESHKPLTSKKQGNYKNFTKEQNDNKIVYCVCGAYLGDMVGNTLFKFGKKVISPYCFNCGNQIIHA